jgi:hypothetical protein
MHSIYLPVLFLHDVLRMHGTHYILHCSIGTLPATVSTVLQGPYTMYASMLYSILHPTCSGIPLPL